MGGMEENGAKGNGESRPVLAAPFRRVKVFPDEPEIMDDEVFERMLVYECENKDNEEVIE